MIGMNVNFGIGFGGGILQRAIMMSGASMGMSIGMPGFSMTMGMGFGVDSAMFSPEALMGGGSNFFHPLMGGGLGGYPMVGASAGMGFVPGMMGCCGPGGVQNRQQQMMMMMILLLLMMMMQQQMGSNMGNPYMMGGMPGMGMSGVGMVPMSGLRPPMMGAFMGVGPNAAFAGAFAAVPGVPFAGAGMTCQRCGFGRIHPRRIRRMHKKLVRFLMKILQMGLGFGILGMGMGMLGMGVGMMQGMF